jgi:hypothetical protein
MSQWDLIAGELKSLPEDKAPLVHDFVHQLQSACSADRRSALAETAGCMTPTEADAFQKSIDEFCERIDHENPAGLD